MISITVSNLDQFRRYRDREELSLADLLKIIRREEPPSDKMLAGRALHKLLETARLGTLERVESEGHTFTFALDAEISLPPIREIRGTKDYRINTCASVDDEPLPPSRGGARDDPGTSTIVRLSGRADSIVGFHGYDHKLTGQFDAQRYHDSYQWRAYMAIFGLRAFTYNVFIGEAKEIVAIEPEHNDGEGGAVYVGPGRSWTIRDFHRITFYDYPELGYDMRAALTEYLTFAQQHLQRAA